jgi:hypothetical protein
MSKDEITEIIWHRSTPDQFQVLYADAPHESRLGRCTEAEEFSEIQGCGPVPISPPRGDNIARWVAQSQ